MPETKKNIAILGSCRLMSLSPNSYIHQVHHTHNTKEAIQYIRYIHGDIELDPRTHKFVFRSCFLDNNFIVNREKLKVEMQMSDFIFVELCSRKKYSKDGFFIHHLAADKGDAVTNILIEEDKKVLYMSLLFKVKMKLNLIYYIFQNFYQIKKLFL